MQTFEEGANSVQDMLYLFDLVPAENTKWLKLLVAKTIATVLLSCTTRGGCKWCRKLTREPILVLFHFTVGSNSGVKKFKRPWDPGGLLYRLEDKPDFKKRGLLGS